MHLTTTVFAMRAAVKAGSQRGRVDSRGGVKCCGEPK
jgi:hypothetical protein